MTGVFTGPAEAGDWVRSTRRFPLSAADRLSGRGGLASGALGVVIDRAGGALRVEFDAPGGPVTVRVRRAEVRTVRRGGGIPAFRKRTRVVGLARLGVALAFAAPFLLFAARYLVANHTTHGLLPSLVLSAIYGTLYSFAADLHQPLRAALYFAVLSGASRFAFGRRPDKD